MYQERQPRGRFSLSAATSVHVWNCTLHLRLATRPTASLGRYAGAFHDPSHPLSDAFFGLPPAPAAGRLFGYASTKRRNRPTAISNASRRKPLTVAGQTPRPLQFT